MDPDLDLNLPEKQQEFQEIQENPEIQKQQENPKQQEESLDQQISDIQKKISEEKSTKENVEVEINNLILINNQYPAFEISENVFIPPIDSSEEITSILVIPTFTYQTIGNKLIIIVIKNKNNQYDLIIVQRISDLPNLPTHYNLLYPDQLNFLDEWKTVKSWIINPPNIQLESPSVQKKYSLQLMTQMYSNKNIESDFMRTLLENNLILPENLEAVEIIINTLNISDIKNLRSLSEHYKHLINQVILNIVRRTFRNELANISEDMLKNIDFISLYKRIKTNRNINLANWAAENGHLDLLEKFIYGLQLPGGKIIKPNRNGANKSAGKGRIDSLEYLASLKTPIFADRRGANLAAKHGHLNVLLWLAGDRPTIKALAKKYNHLDTIEWLEHHGNATFEPDIELDHFPFEHPVLQVQGQFPPQQQFQEQFQFPPQQQFQEQFPQFQGQVPPIIRLQLRDDDGNLIGPEILPTGKGADLALQNNHMYVFTWLLFKDIYPLDRNSSNIALVKGETRFVDILVKRNYPLNINYVMKGVIENGKLNSLEWIEEKLLSEERTIGNPNARAERRSRRIVDSEGNTITTSSILRVIIKNKNKFIVSIIKNGNLDILIWLTKRGLKFNEKDIAMMLINNRYDIVEWILSKSAEISLKEIKFDSSKQSEKAKEVKFPRKPRIRQLDLNVKIANLVAGLGNIDTLNWLEQKGVLPDHRAANYAFITGNKDVEMWLKQRNILPDARSVNDVISDKGDKVKYLSPEKMDKVTEEDKMNILLKFEKEKGYLPTSEGADYAIINGYDNILNWLLSKGILPTSRGADAALMRGRSDIVKFLADKNILPTSRSADFVLLGYYRDNIQPMNDRTNIELQQKLSQEMLDWLFSKGILPTRKSADHLIKHDKFMNLY